MAADLKATNHAAALSIDRDLTTRLHGNASYLVSKPKGAMGMSSLLATFTEPLTARLSATQFLTYSKGRTSINFGGQFISNALTLTATYDTFYVPALNSQPFEQALLLDVKFKVLGRLLLHSASFVDATGHIRYTAEGSTVYSHEHVAKQVEHGALGRYVLHGCVLDAENRAVEGAAVMIDDAPLYTDSKGCFQMRENSPRTHRLRVVIGDFLAAGNWQVVSTPMTVTSATEEESEQMRVVVVVRRVREISQNAAEPSQPAGAMQAENAVQPAPPLAAAKPTQPAQSFQPGTLTRRMAGMEPR